jgi:type IV pilus assembly protein PilB
MDEKTARLKKVLVEGGYVDEKDFGECLQSSADLGRPLEDILIFRGFVDEQTLGKLLAKELGVSYINPSKVTISEELLKLIPENLAKTYRMVPIARKENELQVAMEDPTNFEALEYAKRQTGLHITPLFATNDGIQKALGQYKRNIKSEFAGIIEENAKKAHPGDDPLRAAEELPIIKILDTIFMYAVSERASDIHIEVLEKVVMVRFRIDGILRDIIRLPKGIETAIVARIKILSNLKIDEHRIPQDGRHKFKINEEVIALRISIVPGFYGESVVARILRESARPLSLEELGIKGKNLEVLKKNYEKPHGMVLVTGPTGSGKTTTLYSVLNNFDPIKSKICTVEDPVEYGINRIMQIQMNQKVGLTFSSGLRALLRHDPDIIMVGEIRDKETAEIAIHASLTGHLVLSTLHTNDAVGAIPRMIDMGVEPYLLSSTVNTILAQRLVRKICSSCTKQYAPEKVLIEEVKTDFGLDISGQKFYKGEGCASCGNTGYSGRVGIYEVLNVTEEIRELITKRANSDELATAAKKAGMITMVEDGINKVASGITTIDEVLRVVREK